MHDFTTSPDMNVAEVVAGPRRNAFFQLLRSASMVALLAGVSGLACAQGTPNWNSIGPPGGAVSTLLRSTSAPSIVYLGTSDNASRRCACSHESLSCPVRA